MEKEQLLLVETELGTFAIFEKQNAITKMKMVKEEIAQLQTEHPAPVLLQAKQELLEYLKGERVCFTVPLAPQGTDFQSKVWQALQEIPYGKTATYKEIAVKIGVPKAYRAVGLANNKNPIAIFIPCHRVIGSNGKLTGYAYGLPVKEKLLLLENTPHN